MLNVVPNGPATEYEYNPHMAGIVEWDKSDDFFVLSQNKAFKEKAAPLMDAALSRIDLIHTKMIFD